MSATRRSERSAKSSKSSRSGRRVAEMDDAKKSEVDQAQRDLIFADPKKIDFSGQAAVILPSSIFQRTEIEELHLENNNFRAIPPDIGKLKRLRLLNISKNNLSGNMSEERASNVMAPLPMQLDQLAELAELNISECNLSLIPEVVFKIVSLRILNISRNKVNVLSPNIANLVNLEILNAQYCGLKTLPSDIICCENLTELILYGNALESLPEEFYALTKLTTLKLNTQYFARKLDTHMESLLVRNQLQSTHVPVVMFEMPAIRDLSLECSKLNMLPSDITLSLERISLKFNYFRQFPRSLLPLVNLRIIDFTGNRLLDLPEEIERLVALEQLYVSGNDLAELPNTIVKLHRLQHLEAANNRIRNLPPKIGEMKALQTLMLRHNAIRVLPASICQLTRLETLDVSNNNISSIPAKMYEMTSLKEAHCYRRIGRYGLWLKHNPLSKPPPVVWRTTDTENIWNWLKRQEYVKMDKVKQFKVVLIGNSGSGKSCLKNALLNRLPISHRLPFVEESAPDSVFEADDVRQTKSAPARRTSVAPEMNYVKQKTSLELGTFKQDSTMDSNLPEQKSERSKSIKFASEPNLTSEDSELSEKSSLKNAESTTSLLLRRYAELLIAAGGHDITRVLSIGSHAIVDGIKLCVYDISGHETYRFLAPLFLQEQAFVLVTADLEKFLKDYEAKGEAAYNDHVGKWIELCWTYAPKALVKVVFTHLDTGATLPSFEETTKWLSKRVTSHLASLKATSESGLEYLRSSRTDTTVYSKAALNALEDLDTYRKEHLQKAMFLDSRLVHYVSNTYTMENITDLTVDLARNANYSENFKKLQIYVSESWNVLRRRLKRTGEIVLTLAEVRVLADMYTVKGQAFTDFLEYFTLSGEFIWLKTHAILSQYVIVKPAKFAKVLQGVYRHDLDSYLDDNQTMLKYRSDVRDTYEFEECKKMCCEYGQLSEPILRALWFYHSPTQQQFRMWTELITEFEACYSIEWPDSVAARRAMRRALKVPIITVPPYVNDVVESNVNQILKLKADSKTTRVVCRATPFLPNDLLLRLSIALQDVVYERLDWQNAIFCSKDEKDFLVRKETDETDKPGCSNDVLSFYFASSRDNYPWIKSWLFPVMERVRLWYPSHVLSLWLDSVMLMVA